MKITWDEPEKRIFTTGISNGVLYPEKAPGIAWNGLVSVTEFADQDKAERYLDGIGYKINGIPGAFSGSISAFTFPDELLPYISTIYGNPVQKRGVFGLSYQTNREIHLVYNVLLARTTREYSTTGKKVEPVSLDWNFTTVPVKIPGGKPASHFVILIDGSPAVSEIERLIYGDDVNEPSLPLPEDVINIFESHTTLRITDNGDGTWAATDNGEAITIIDSDTFRINWPSVIFISGTVCRISSL